MFRKMIKSKPLSQEERLLRLLRKAGSRGVENHEFPKHRILRYSARIGDLRKDGYNIYCERQRLPNGRATSTYKYYLIEDKS